MWQEEQWVRCSGCGHPRDEVWPRDGFHEVELRERFYAEAMLCVACDEISKEQRRWDKQQSAHAGGVYMVLREEHPGLPGSTPEH